MEYFHLLCLDDKEDEFMILKDYAQLGEVSNKRVRIIIIKENE